MAQVLGKEAGTVRWFEIESTPELIARAEASLATAKHIQELEKEDASTRGQEIQFYSCFLSYSTKDQEFADRLYLDLKEKGVNCWFAPHDIRGGRKVHEQIGEAIRIYDRLLLILSESSMNSEWVKTEIGHARERELNEKRQVLFPIGLVPFAKIREWTNFDARIGKDSAREIQEYYIPDFSGWQKAESYREALMRLVRDLQTK